MSENPKEDLMRKSGPLGQASGIPRQVVENATPTQAAILYQNDQQLQKLAELKGSVETGFSGAHGRMDRMERLFNERLAALERFQDRLMLVPEGMNWFIKVGGAGAIISASAWVAHIVGIIN